MTTSGLFVLISSIPSRAVLAEMTFTADEAKVDLNE